MRLPCMPVIPEAGADQGLPGLLFLDLSPLFSPIMGSIFYFLDFIVMDLVDEDLKILIISIF